MGLPANYNLVLGRLLENRHEGYGLEADTWVQIFVALRDERREIMAKVARRRIIEEENSMRQPR